jgi:hypothetical protein
VNPRFVVFDATTGKRTAVCDGHRDSIWAFTFSPDGTLVSGSGDILDAAREDA